ncbi:DoxX family protein [Edaphobacter modestus]|uniref:DoxX family protein n=1 Tax=Edaphobacter modestus TaxID=388466 RepID=UPI0013EE8F85|nr:DoxX family protein [Edaphobacter modestus]
MRRSWPATHIPCHFRIELSRAKLAGVAALLVPMVPARLKEWAYAGFAITLVSALIATSPLAMGSRRRSWSVRDRGSVGRVVPLLAPPAGHADERPTADRRSARRRRRWVVGHIELRDDQSYL